MHNFLVIITINIVNQISAQQLSKTKLLSFFVFVVLAFVYGFRLINIQLNAQVVDSISADSESRRFTQETTVDTSVLAATTIAQDPILFSDDFSTDLGWQFIQSSVNGTGFYSLQQGELELGLNELGFNVRYISPMTSNNLSCEFSVTVNAHKTQGINTMYGFTFNFVDTVQFYRFIINPDTQHFQLQKFDPTNGYSLLSEGQSTSIRSGTQTNSLMIIRNCKQIRVFANNTLLAEVNDDQYLSGVPGLVVRSGTNTSEIPAAARFDNFIVKDGRTDLNADGMTNTLDAQLLLRRIGQ